MTYDKKILDMAERLNQLSENDIIKSFVVSTKSGLTPNILKLYSYYCENNPRLAYKVLNNMDEETKEDLKKSFFHIVLNSELSKDLFRLLDELDLKEEYFKDKEENLLDFDDVIYDVYVGDEKHEKYIDYISKCINTTGKLPSNTERLILSDLEVNEKAINKIEELEKELFEKEKYNLLINFASYTKTVDKLEELLNLENLYEYISNKHASYKARRIAFLNQGNTLLEWFNLVNSFKNKNVHIICELLIVRLKLIIEENIINIPEIINTSSITNLLKEHPLTEEELYEYFIYNCKLIDKYYTNPRIYNRIANFDNKYNLFRSKSASIGINKIEYLKYKDYPISNSDLINFLQIDKVKQYLKKEKEVLLKQVTILLQNNEKYNLEDDYINYFSSILKYIIPLEDLLIIERDNRTTFPIYNTLLEGRLDIEEDNYYLSTVYGKIKMSFVRPVKKTTVCPHLKMQVNLVDYNYETNTFNVNNAKWFLDEENKQLYREIIDNCLKLNIKESYHKVFNNFEFLVYCFLKKPLYLEYLYLKYEEEFRLKEIIKTGLLYTSSLEETSYLEKVFTDYVINRDEELLINKIVEYTNILLEKNKDNYLNDLTVDKEFSTFRETINRLFIFISDLDKELFNKLIKKLKDNNLLSLTYYKETDIEYFKDIKEVKYIKDFYKYYPSTYIEDHEFDFLNEDFDDNIKFYCVLKLLDRYPLVYDEHKELLIKYFREDTPYKEWIRNIQINLYRYQNANLLYLVTGTEYSNKKFTEEEKIFEEKYNKVININKVLPTGNTIKEILESIDRIIPEETTSKLKELSSKELSKEEKITLAPIIKDLIINHTIKPQDIYRLLESLGTNNPYHMSNEISYDELPKFENTEKRDLVALTAIQQSQLKKMGIICMSPRHFIDDFIDMAGNLYIRTLRLAFNDFIIRGKLKVNKNNSNDKFTVLFDNLVVPIHKVKIINKISLPYNIIPEFDTIKFKFISLTETKEMQVEEIIDFSYEEELLNKVKEDSEFFNTLTIEDKKKVLLHYARYNVLESFLFDKDKIIDKDTYAFIAKKLSEINDNSPITNILLINLISDDKDEFKKSLLEIEDSNLKQLSLIEVQKYIYKEKDFNLYDRLIEYLNELNYLNMVYIIPEAREELKERKVFKELYKEDNPKDIYNVKKIKADISEYFELKSLDINILKNTYYEDSYKYYLNNNYKWVLNDKRETIYMLYVIIKIIVTTGTITSDLNNKINYLIEKGVIYNDDVGREVLIKSVDSDIPTLIEIIRNEEDKSKLIPLSRIIPKVREEVENILKKDNKSYSLGKILDTDSYYLNIIRKNTKDRLNEVAISRRINIYSDSFMDLFEYILEKLEIYTKLRLYNFLNVICSELKEHDLLVRDLIFSKDTYELLNKDNRKEISKGRNKKYNSYKERIDSYISTSEGLRKAFYIFIKYYRIDQVSVAKFRRVVFKDLKNLFKEINNYYSNNEAIPFDKKIIEFYLSLYYFEKQTESIPNKKYYYNLLLDYLNNNNILVDDLLLTYGIRKAYYYFNNNLYNSKDESDNLDSLEEVEKKTVDSKVDMDKSMDTYKLYRILKVLKKHKIEEYMYNIIYAIMKDKYYKERYEDAYYIALQLLIDYPTKEITKDMEKVMEKEIVVYPSRMERFIQLYEKASRTLINNNMIDSFYILTKKVGNRNPFYSTLVSRGLDEVENIDNIINNNTLTKEQKVYLYMRSILKHTYNFNEYIYRLYKDELESSKELKLDLDYLFVIYLFNNQDFRSPIKIDIDTDRISDYQKASISIKITNTYLENNKVKFDYEVIETGENESEIYIVKENDELNKLIDKNNIKPWESLLNAIITSKRDYNNTLEKYVEVLIKNTEYRQLLFNIDSFEAISSIYYVSKVLYENKRNILLLRVLKTLQLNRLLNNRFIYKEININEYLPNTIMNMPLAVQDNDKYILENLNFDKDLLSNLEEMLKSNKTPNEVKLYIYYYLCLEKGCFDYKIDITYTDELKKMYKELFKKIKSKNRIIEEYFEDYKTNNPIDILKDNYNELVEESY